jgi:hypothetical protein
MRVAERTRPSSRSIQYSRQFRAQREEDPGHVLRFGNRSLARFAVR